MTRISTRAHALFMYLFSALMILGALVFVGDTGGVEMAQALGVAPYVGQAAVWVAVCAGVLLLALNLWTDFEYAYKRTIPVGGTLGLEVLIGAALIASPWVLGFVVLVAWPHVFLGLVIIGVALLTEREPRDERL